MAIDHTTLFVPEAKFQECLNFYLSALKPLGYQIRHQYGEFVVGLGSTNEDLDSYKRADFWVFGTKTVPERPAHIAFTCHNHASVDAFHAAAVKAGGKDNGLPGLRSFYHPKYYAAFVLDPAGNNIEAVDHGVSLDA
ncbi:Glyoxalase/Bleomycin resistance protein/Dihydroxybiphenyl dioxygenase [Aspergillus transmontanensis]|uniref:Glyoxalase/Bleomycin resistance protein/Dihydroxybiphenyl dioxygenase n=2 Tax=Aspergillus subgen. Circumdati TaxID=2720871 RepID=A0A5N6W3D0_9EURO|nr:Glyoxalase/Bleomycin resistance protein/Dihydroxybiphenyl dioxygenase [Aspergillus transmontanensis]